MNRIFRLSIILFGFLFLIGAFSFIFVSDIPKYDIKPNEFPITVRMWSGDIMIGGISPALPAFSEEDRLVSLILAGNDVIHVQPDAPQCPIMSIAFVTPDEDIQPNTRVYSGTVRCLNP